MRNTRAYLLTVTAVYRFSSIDSNTRSTLESFQYNGAPQLYTTTDTGITFWCGNQDTDVQCQPRIQREQRRRLCVGRLDGSIPYGIEAISEISR